MKNLVRFGNLFFLPRFLWKTKNRLDKKKMIREIALLCKKGDLESIRLETDDIVFSQKTPGGDTLLHIAAKNNHRDICEFLLTERGASVDAGDHWRKTPLYYAWENGNFEIMNLLFSHGADANISQGEKNESVFQMSLRKGDVPMLEFLLKKGASVLPRLASRETCLHVAARMEREDLCKLVLDNGARLNAQNICGKRAVDVCSKNGKVFKFLNSLS